MIVDTSAILTMAFAEQHARRILELLGIAEVGRISAANLLESFVVVDRRGNAQAIQLVESIVQRVGLTVEPVTLNQVKIAPVAWQRFGRGSGHGTNLNFGDCVAYALASQVQEPLRFIGNDFAQTDLVPAFQET